MNENVKKLIGVVLSALLGVAVGFAAKNGVEIKCPKAPSAVIESK